ncbi:DNA methyltransferase [Vibrio nigripulchritudo]|uniref:DNA methyltransferase n=1 Tax=Vibrio nigripulchritudo TaxID=28173 RepID=UPI0003B20665|nr:site-specific DNA-methyltransferase [Vibrio nigripulchritudo]CCO40991.1 Adenine specific DNA methylase Mod [Vibrio nigripulchritudo SFn135]
MSNDQTNVEQYEFEPIKGQPMLRWDGKRPFRSTQYFPAQLKEVYGQEDKNGWLNKIFWGDNLQVMSHLLKQYRGKIDFVYIDPPYDSAADYKMKIKVKGKTALSSASSFEEKQYTDIWSNDEYLQFMYERLTLIRELLSEQGILSLHCDWHKSHHLRCILDEIFGPERFVNEITWHYYNKMQGNIGRFASNHDQIIIYSKGDSYKFNKIRELRDKPIKQIKRVWSSETQSLVNAKDSNGNVIYIDSTHKTVDDVWRLSMLQPADKLENMNYPTQKPESLIERLIYAFTDENDLVFDCFSGAGSVAATAEKMGRRFIVSDINLSAVSISIQRLSQILSSTKDNLPIKNGLTIDNYSESLVNRKGSGFEVYNVNNYDVFRNPVEAKELLIESLEIQKLESNTAYDGEKDGYKVKIMPVNRIATKADLDDLIANLPYKQFEARKEAEPNKSVEEIMLVCMGHEPSLAADLENDVLTNGYKVKVKVVDILRDKSDLTFKYDSEASISAENGKLSVDAFYPRNLLQKLSQQKDDVTEWREMVESIMIDWNYDGAVMEPTLIDIPAKNDFVKGEYEIPDGASNIKIKITDLLSESYEEVIVHG